MKIETPPPSPPPATPPVRNGTVSEAAPQQRAAVAANAAQGAAEQAPVQDRVRIDNPAAVAVRSADSEQRAIRTERMKKLQEAIHNGTYRPDPEAIANRILDSAKWIADLDTELEKISSFAADEQGKKTP